MANFSGWAKRNFTSRAWPMARSPRTPPDSPSLRRNRPRATLPKSASWGPTSSACITSRPNGLWTFTNYPPTEFLRPQGVDFVCFNVYLHQEQAFKNYLARLQMLAEAKPLLLGELGIDSLREGEARKCEILKWQIETAFRGGLA